MRALYTAVLYFGSFLVLGWFGKRLLDKWTAQHPGITHAMGVLDDLRRLTAFDVATLSVALRELRNLSQGDVHR